MHPCLSISQECTALCWSSTLSQIKIHQHWLLKHEKRWTCRCSFLCVHRKYYLLTSTLLCSCCINREREAYLCNYSKSCLPLRHRPFLFLYQTDFVPKAVHPSDAKRLPPGAFKYMRVSVHTFDTLSRGLGLLHWDAEGLKGGWVALQMSINI